MKKAAELIKQKRIEKELTLRTFCKLAELDPSNWSKVERSIMEFPKGVEVLNKISEVLELSDDEYQEIKAMSIIEAIPSGMISEQKLLDTLPVFFRTTLSENPTEEQLKELINLIKNS